MEKFNYIKVPIGIDKEICFSRDAISLKDFAQFVSETGYKTFFENFDEMDNWLNNGFIEGKLDFQHAIESERSSSAVVYLVKRDACAFCEWSGDIRLPTLSEIISATCYFEEKNVSFASRSCVHDLVDGCQNGDAVMIPSLESIKTMKKIFPSKTLKDMIMDTLCWSEESLSAVGSFRICKK